MSGKASALSNEDEEYGSFDPGTILKGPGNGSISVAAPSIPALHAPATTKARSEALNPGSSSGQDMLPDPPGSATTSSAADIALQAAALHAAKSTATGPLSDVGEAQDALPKAVDKAADDKPPTPAEHVDRAHRQDPAPPVPASNPASTDVPSEIFNADALYSLAHRVSSQNRGLATRLRHGATHSVIMDSRDLAKLLADYNTAIALAGPEEHASTPPAAFSVEPKAVAAAAPTSAPSSAPLHKGASAAAPAPARNSPGGGADAAEGTAKGTATGDTAGGQRFDIADTGARSGRTGRAHTPDGAVEGASGPNAAQRGSDGASEGAPKGSSSGGQASTGGAKKPALKPGRAPKRAAPAPADDAGSLADSESNSDDDDGDDDDKDAIPPPEELLRDEEVVSASLKAVLEAISYAGPRQESSTRPTGAQTHAIAVLEQHIRVLTEFACSRLGFSQERVLRNIADMVPARLGNGYNVFRSFLKCTDPDYTPRRDLDELLGCKPKYTTAEHQSLYEKLRDKVGQEALDELLLEFDIQYPYGVPDPTRGDREKSFDASTGRAEKLFRHFSAKYYPP